MGSGGSGAKVPPDDEPVEKEKKRTKSKHHELTEVEKWSIYAYASRFYYFKYNKFQKGCCIQVAKEFKVSERTVQRIMKEASEFNDPTSVSFASHKIGVVGAKRKHAEQDSKK